MISSTRGDNTATAGGGLTAISLVMAAAENLLGGDEVLSNVSCQAQSLAFIRETGSDVSLCQSRSEGRCFQSGWSFGHVDKCKCRVAKPLTPNMERKG